MKTPQFPAAPRAAAAALSIAGIAAASIWGASPAAGAGTQATAAASSTLQFVATTPAATKAVSTVNWNLEYEPASLDPIKTQVFADAPVESNMCQSLLKVEPDLSVQPLLATAVRQVNSLEWRYTLRHGVHFWDGGLMTSADVVASLRRNINPKDGSYWSLEFANVKSISAAGKYAVIIRFTRPDALLNQALSTSAGAISQASALSKAGGSYGSAKSGLMCTGPFKFGSWQAGSSITLLRNASYWDRRAEPRVTKLVFHFITNPSTIASALSTGSIDGMYELPASAIPQLRSTSAGHLYMGQSTASLDLIPTERQGPLHSTDIRQALFQALDRAAVASGVYHDAAEPAKSFINPGFGYGASVYDAYLASRPTPNVNFAVARKLVSASGINTSTPIKIAISPDPALTTVANALVAAASSIGLHMTVVTLTASQDDELYFNQKMRDQYDGFLDVQWTLTTDPLEEMEFVTKGAFTNYGLYDNKQFQSLFYKALGIANPTQRAKAAVQALKIVDRDMPWVPIVSLPVTTFIKKGLTGIPTSWSFLYGGWAQGLGGTSH